MKTMVVFGTRPKAIKMASHDCLNTKRVTEMSC